MDSPANHGRVEDNSVLYDCDARFQWGDFGESVSAIMFDTRRARAIARQYQGIWLWGTRETYDGHVYHDPCYLAGHMGW